MDELGATLIPTRDRSPGPRKYKYRRLVYQWTAGKKAFYIFSILFCEVPDLFRLDSKTFSSVIITSFYFFKF